MGTGAKAWSAVPVLAGKGEQWCQNPTVWVLHTQHAEIETKGEELHERPL